VGYTGRHDRDRDPEAAVGLVFPDWLLERRKRAERATSVLATSYLPRVRRGRMEKLVETLGITRLSKSQVSVMAKNLDGQVEAFRTRPLDAGPYTFLAADALTMKVREGGQVVNVVNRDGHRDFSAVLSRIRGRLADLSPWPGRPWPVRVSLVTSDAHLGLTAAIGATLPGGCWPRCPTHYAANLVSVTPKARGAG
jgi:putative transposase